MTTLEILKAARKTLRNPGRWTQGEFARTKSGVGVDWDHPGAVCWCLVGAVYAGCQTPQQKMAAYTALIRQAGGAVSSANDSSTHPEVLALLDRAIETERLS